MAKKSVGDTFQYVDENDVTYLATVVNTYTDKNTNTDMCTISVTGKGSTIVIENK